MQCPKCGKYYFIEGHCSKCGYTKQLTEEEKKKEKRQNTFAFIAFIALALIVIVLLCKACGGSSDHYVRYHYLSPQEKENAKWAYEAKKALENYHN